MSAKMEKDKAYFRIGVEKESFSITADQVVPMVLNTLERGIMLLVNRGDDESLTALQACTSELFRRAAECRKQGKRMEV